MAWDPLDDDTYTGDLPMDAFAAALGRTAERFTATNQRLPLTAEVADALLDAIHEAREVGRAGEADALLARWRMLPRVVPTEKRPRAQAGDILEIPYGSDGARRIVARVLFTPSKKQPGPGLGLCIVVHDLDAPVAVDAVRAAPLLIGPCHLGDDEIVEGRWRIAGHVEPDDAELPLFACQLPNGKGGWRNALRDYFGTEVPDTPENRARVAEASVGSPSHVVVGIRMLRGLTRWLPTYAESLHLRRPR